MSSVPRRRAGRAGHDDELRQSLLGAGEGEGEGSTAVATRRNTARELILHPLGSYGLSLEGFVHFVAQSWMALLGALRDCLQWLCPWRRDELDVAQSLLQAERLEELAQRQAERYDAADPQHQSQLCALWALGFPDEPCSELRTPRWKDMGWQGDDPATDIRGAGLLGLDNLVMLGTSHPRLFHALMHKTRGTRADMEYPFAAAGLNVTALLTAVLGLAGGGGPPPPPGAAPPANTRAGRAFAALLAADETAFDSVYAATFARLDELWLARGASYMQFNAVLSDVRTRLVAALSRRPASIAELRRSFGVSDEWW